VIYNLIFYVKGDTRREIVDVQHEYTEYLIHGYSKVRSARALNAMETNKETI
jgi:hypothetical protein